MEQIKIKSKYDDLQLDVIISSCKNPKGIVQLVHGMCEYKERYLDFINYLNQAGYIVIIHDHRGHGKSVKTKEDLGYFYDDSANAIVEDVYMLSEYIKGLYPNLPLYLFGHSMGSLVVRNYIQRYDHEISGLIVCGSPSFNRFAGIGKCMCKIITKLKGPKYRSNIINKLSVDTYNKGFKKPNEWICSDDRVVDSYNNDSFCTFMFTINGFKNLFTLMQRTYQKIDYKINNSLPILFIAGENDPCIINQKYFAYAINHLKEGGYNKVEAVLFKGMRHEILNEKEKDKVYDVVLDFLRRQNEL